MSSDVVRLVVPARREALSVLRIMAGNAARLSGFGYNRVEEARLAVNEAASLLVADGGSSTLRCTLTGDGTRLEVEIEADPGPAIWPPTGWEDSLEHAVLSTVTDWHELGIGDNTRVKILLGQNGS